RGGDGHVRFPVPAPASVWAPRPDTGSDMRPVRRGEPGIASGVSRSLSPGPFHTIVPPGLHAWRGAPLVSEVRRNGRICGVSAVQHARDVDLLREEGQPDQMVDRAPNAV